MKNILLHVHIFKNAGSSFDDALKRFYGDAFVDHRDDNDIIKGKMAYLENYLDAHPKIQAFSSHSIYFNPENSDKYHFFPAYFLREPIGRIRSVYSFEKKQMPATTQGSKKAKELDFNGFVKWYMEDTSPATIRNIQTIFLSGTRTNQKSIEEKFSLAMNTLNNFPLIGVVDRYDESMVVFEEYLKDSFPGIDLSYIRKNVTDTNIEDSVEEKTNKILSQLDTPTKVLVQEKNALDMKLYERANEKLDAKLDAIENFEKKLIDFKERCVLKLVNVKINSNDFNCVVEFLKPIVKNGAKNVHLYLALANARKELKQYSKALTLYEGMMKKFPNNPWPYFYQAEMYLLMGDEEKSKKLFKLYAAQFKDRDKVISTFEQRLG